MRSEPRFSVDRRIGPCFCPCRGYAGGFRSATIKGPGRGLSPRCLDGLIYFRTSTVFAAAMASMLPAGHANLDRAAARSAASVAGHERDRVDTAIALIGTLRPHRHAARPIDHRVGAAVLLVIVTLSMATVALDSRRAAICAALIASSSPSSSLAPLSGSSRVAFVTVDRDRVAVGHTGDAHRDEAMIPGVDLGRDCRGVAAIGRGDAAPRLPTDVAELTAHIDCRVAHRKRQG